MITNPFPVPFDRDESKSSSKNKRQISWIIHAKIQWKWRRLPRMVNLQDTINSIGILTGWLPENFSKPFCDAGAMLNLVLWRMVCLLMAHILMDVNYSDIAQTWSTETALQCPNLICQWIAPIDLVSLGNWANWRPSAKSDWSMVIQTVSSKYAVYWIFS